MAPSTNRWQKITLPLAPRWMRAAPAAPGMRAYPAPRDEASFRGAKRAGTHSGVRPFWTILDSLCASGAANMARGILLVRNFSNRTPVSLSLFFLARVHCRRAGYNIADEGARVENCRHIYADPKYLTAGLNDYPYCWGSIAIFLWN